ADTHAPEQNRSRHQGPQHTIDALLGLGQPRPAQSPRRQGVRPPRKCSLPDDGAEMGTLPVEFCRPAFGFRRCGDDETTRYRTACHGRRPDVVKTGHAVPRNYTNARQSPHRAPPESGTVGVKGLGRRRSRQHAAAVARRSAANAFLPFLVSSQISPMVRTLATVAVHVRPAEWRCGGEPRFPQMALQHAACNTTP
ncbi:hypothetical protein TcCL_ESM06228, partial [Trypanosoma cruzi]